MANEDMEGQFFGGGTIDYVVSGGEIYLKSEHLNNVMAQLGLRLSGIAIAEQNPSTGATAHMVLSIAEALMELRSELLRQEAEKSLLPPAEPFGTLFDGI
jgi:hypothetical protein